ncbi:MAG: hypothetical protein IPM66_20340 [Acidobacteriota bacterium]|nr:MAG: hypothetical protein IPM66_20340 [Acidobacteriota bacterium]
MKPFQVRPIVFIILIIAGLPAVASAQIQFDRPKTEQPLENPYTLGVPREQILETTKDILKKCGIPLDEEASKPAEGKLVTKPVVFSRGVTTRNDLEYLAVMPASDVRNWTQGRYYLEISALPLDQKRSQIYVAAHIQGRMPDPLTGHQWIEGQSNGRLEDEVIRGLAGKLLGIDLSLKKSGNPRRILNCEY